MPRPEFQERQIWEKLYAAEENQLAQGLEERSFIEGEDGEIEFDRRVLASVKDKRVIDIGCGTGEFTLEIAAIAKQVAGVDFSKRALSKARENLRSKKSTNVEVKLAPADELPYPGGSFDQAISRRGPAIDTRASAKEVWRVLMHSGEFMAQEIGERDKQNWAQVFGRGQLHSSTIKVAAEKRKMLIEAGFRKVIVEDFEAKEYFASLKDVLMRLENSPIILNFDREVDKGHLEEIARRFTTPKGIATSTHRILVTASK